MQQDVDCIDEVGDGWYQSGPVEVGNQDADGQTFWAWVKLM